MAFLDQIIARYKSATYYRDKGNQKVVRITKNNEIVVKSTTTFEITMDGKDEFILSYTKLDNRGKQLIKGLIQKNKDSQKVICRIEENDGRIEELRIFFKEAIAMHTGLSNGISYLVPSLIYGQELSGSQFYEGGQIEDRECNKNGETHFELTVSKVIQTEPVDIAPFKIFAEKNRLDEKYLAALEKNQKALMSMNQKINQVSKFYFRLRDYLLIRQEKTMEIGDDKYLTETNYNPELS